MFDDHEAEWLTCGLVFVILVLMISAMWLTRGS